ncbi:MAG: ABC transporter substrate-binding protein [Chloroflexi bacterium]|nr:ABC transporter substrate-binding protein [Chloroflexota bacterium]
MPRFSILVAVASVLVVALVGLAACSDDDDSGSGTQADSLTFMPGFKPQANLPFVGAYVADKEGFFAEENLDVKIQHVTTPGDNFRFLAAGEVQITTADASSLLEHRGSDPPLDLVSIALIGQRGQQGFAVLADSGIDSPTDWVGKTVGYKGSQVTPDYLAILGAAEVDRGSMNEVRVGFAPQVLAEGQVDIYPVFVSNEPDTLERLGFDVTVFEAADFGAPTLGLTYVTSQEYIDENPDIVLRFLRAALRGIAYAESDPAETIDIVLEFADQEDPEHQRFMMDTELGMAHGTTADANGIGWQTEEQWQRLHDYLVTFGALTGPLTDITEAFDDSFLAEIYADGPDSLK